VNGVELIQVSQVELLLVSLFELLH